MDPITHALSGAVFARAFVPESPDASVARTTRWALVLGSIFPDIDIIAKPFVPDDFSTIRFHRSLTHSLVCLPVWAVLFALGAMWFCRRRGIPAPRPSTLGVAFGVGIALHILFDCITSFGTMAWSPLSWRRLQWDWTFILDLSLTGVLLFFLLISWVAEGTQHRIRRATLMLVLISALMAVYALTSYDLGRPAPVSSVACVVVLAALPLIAAWSRRSLALTASAWCRAGVLATAAYLGMNAWAHARALEQVRVYAAVAHLDVIEAAAIPLPPNLNFWQGFVRTGSGMYEWTISLASPPAVPLPTSITPLVSGAGCPPVLWTIPQVNTWMRFARFPVVVCSQAPDGQAAEFVDLRFRRPELRWGVGDGNSRPIPFTWRVTFDVAGHVLTEGWVTR